jgi:hypothetical protein
MATAGLREGARSERQTAGVNLLLVPWAPNNASLSGVKFTGPVERARDDALQAGAIIWRAILEPSSSHTYARAPRMIFQRPTVFATSATNTQNFSRCADL